MVTARISEYRSRLSHFHRTVLENHEPLVVSGSSRGDVVVLPAEDYEKLRETIGILKDRATMNSLLESRSGYYDGTVDAQDMGEVFGDVLDGTD